MVRCLTIPSSITPTRNIARSSFKRWGSLMRSSTASINLSWGIASKQLAMSDSTTQRRPRKDSSSKTCRASCGARLGKAGIAPHVADLAALERAMFGGRVNGQVPQIGTVSARYKATE